MKIEIDIKDKNNPFYTDIFVDGKKINCSKFNCIIDVNKNLQNLELETLIPRNSVNSFFINYDENEVTEVIPGKHILDYDSLQLELNRVTE